MWLWKLGNTQVTNYSQSWMIREIISSSLSSIMLENRTHVWRACFLGKEQTRKEKENTSNEFMSCTLHFTNFLFFADKKRVKTDEGDNTEVAQLKELKCMHIWNGLSLFILCLEITSAAYWIWVIYFSKSRSAFHSWHQTQQCLIWRTFFLNTLGYCLDYKNSWTFLNLLSRLMLYMGVS